ncbi:hypothetical protein [Kitasatospora sp. NPDC101183]|uniref:hypothetical protein n=1 Tax=Kitasatospora sp. NPDC101183 TaxID=3364100 RepID=UPI003804D4B5
MDEDEPKAPPGRPEEHQEREHEPVTELLREKAPPRPGRPALTVPEQPAVQVIAQARRLATEVAPRGRHRPTPDLLRVAKALVVDEHPSAPGWSAAERELLAGWVAVLIEHRGEDGVQQLVSALNLLGDGR